MFRCDQLFILYVLSDFEAICSNSKAQSRVKGYFFGEEPAVGTLYFSG